MSRNPFSSVQQKFMQKCKGVIDLDNIMVGRKVDEKPLGGLKCIYKYRTGFFGGEIIKGEVPVTKIRRLSSPHNPEGIEVILPFTKGSLGYHEFHSLPLVKLAIIETRLAELQLELEEKIEGAAEIKSFSELQQLIFSVVDMIQNVRKGIEAPEISPTLMAPPEQMGVQ